MAKVVLDSGITVDALVLVKANLRDYMNHSRGLIEKAEKANQPEHRNELVMLQNMVYALSLDLENLPIRKYKQK